MTANNTIYMGAPVALTTLDNGAVTNAEAWRRFGATSYLEPTIDRVSSQVTCFGGDGFLNLTLIEGDDGLILFDTGESIADGVRFLSQIRAISDKPIVAVIYSHSHYVHGTDVLIGDGAGVKIIGHANLNANLAMGGTGTAFAETAPLQMSRTLQQFNHYTPKSGPNAAAGAHIAFGRSGALPVNTVVSDGERMTIAGVELEFFTRYGTDSDDCVVVHLPQSGVVLNNAVWPFVPNVYTLRAAKFRDPREWRDALITIRNLNPKALVNTHARAIVGQDQAMSTLDDIIDGLNAILDQSLRGMLLGLGPEDLRTFVKLPAHLAASPNLAEIYGEVSHFGPYLFNHALGWFDGDAASINPLPPTDQATRLVDAMGGSEAVLTRTREAFARQEFAWAAQLINYLYRLDPADGTIRTLKADILEQLGRVTPAHTIRSWYMTQASALRGEIHPPLLQFANPRAMAIAEPADTLDQFRIRIDPEKSASMDTVVAVSITDRSARHVWHLRRGVVEFLRDPDKARRTPDLELACDYDTWLRFFACKSPLADFLARVDLVTGTAAQAEGFFSAFDAYDTRANAILGY